MSQISTTMSSFPGSVRLRFSGKTSTLSSNRKRQRTAKRCRKRFELAALMLLLSTGHDVPGKRLGKMDVSSRRITLAGEVQSSEGAEMKEMKTKRTSKFSWGVLGVGARAESQGNEVSLGTASGRLIAEKKIIRPVVSKSSSFFH